MKSYTEVIIKEEPMDDAKVSKADRRALQFLEEKGPPKIEPSQAGQQLRDFMSRSLCIDENKRASVGALLEDAFIQKSCSTDRLGRLVAQQKEWNRNIL